MQNVKQVVVKQNGAVKGYPAPFCLIKMCKKSSRFTTMITVWINISTAAVSCVYGAIRRLLAGVKRSGRP